MKPDLSHLPSLMMALLGTAMLLFGNFFISALPEWTGYFPIPGIMLAHIRGVAFLCLSVLLFHEETRRQGKIATYLLTALSVSYSPLNIAITILTLLPHYLIKKLPQR